MDSHLEYTLNWFNIPEERIDIRKVINVYLYGSLNYETNTEKSDYDYIIVYDQENDISETLTTHNIGVVMNATLMSPSYFQKRLDDNCIDVMECFFLREDYKFITMDFSFKLDLDMLRRSISAVCSNSFVKCKKKLQDKEDYIGKKSLFHSLRIADYGIQIAKFGKIVDYTKPQSETLKYDSFKALLDEVMSYTTWYELKDKYQVIANNLRTEFRIVAPLKED